MVKRVAHNWGSTEHPVKIFSKKTISPQIAYQTYHPKFIYTISVSEHSINFIITQQGCKKLPSSPFNRWWQMFEIKCSLQMLFEVPHVPPLIGANDRSGGCLDRHSNNEIRSKLIIGHNCVCLGGNAQDGSVGAD